MVLYMMWEMNWLCGAKCQLYTCTGVVQISSFENGGLEMCSKIMYTEANHCSREEMKALLVGLSGLSSPPMKNNFSPIQLCCSGCSSFYWQTNCWITSPMIQHLERNSQQILESDLQQSRCSFSAQLQWNNEVDIRAGLVILSVVRGKLVQFCQSPDSWVIVFLHEPAQVIEIGLCI